MKNNSNRLTVYNKLGFAFLTILGVEKLLIFNAKGEKFALKQQQKTTSGMIRGVHIPNKTNVSDEEVGGDTIGKQFALRGQE